ncbi:hypothetical protein [Thermococcus stetteri]|uniref:hypothetical protein n=1 Tax=Thermococcus stetteri TaxID=49900 RepID=UPI001AE19DE9|nr:hypothetical protein [Thermococcus stetteri]MBP1911751.1 hypothetical protein [Thermococcus stetteri]
MKKGQLSIDFMFAVVLVMITVLDLVYIASGEQARAEDFDVAAKVKAFTIDVRDTVVKVYSMGDGYKVRKEVPLNLGPGDSVSVVLDSADNKIKILARVGEKSYYSEQRVPVPVYESSSVTLNSVSRDFWIVAEYNKTEGKTYVTFSP